MWHVLQLECASKSALDQPSREEYFAKVQCRGRLGWLIDCRHSVRIIDNGNSDACALGWEQLEAQQNRWEKGNGLALVVQVQELR